MTAQEIRESVPSMVIWMADAAIRQARKAITGKTGWNDINRNPYNMPEVEMAGEILFRMFHTFTGAIKDALLAMPEELDGVYDITGMNYYDEFVKALSEKGKTYGFEVKLREPNWILETA